MRTVRLHTSLYREPALRETIAIFADYGTFDLRTQPPYLEVGMTPAAGVDEGQLAGEFCNYALALSVQAKG